METDQAPSSCEASAEAASSEDHLKELERDRRANDDKLRSRFNHIYEKYNRDFTGIGDEIDIETGEIVINNGHLEHMHNEVDPSNNFASSQFVRNFQRGLEHEDGQGFSEHEINCTASVDDNEDDALDDELEISSVERPLPEGGSRENSAVGSLRAISRPAPRLAHLLVNQDAKNSVDLTALSSGNDSNDDGDSTSATSGDMLEQIPALRDSMLSLKSRRQLGHSMNQDAINALGMDIANQLAKLWSNTAPRAKRKLKVEPEDPEEAGPTADPAPEIQRRHTGNLQPNIAAPASPGAKSIWAPLDYPRAQKRRRQTAPNLDKQSSDQLQPGGEGLDEDPPDGTPPRRKCANCGTHQSRDWRLGPSSESLCTTCGMYFYRYGLMKPLESPPSSDDQDSDPELSKPREKSRTGTSMAELYETASSVYLANTSRPIRAGIGRPRLSRFTPEEDALIIKLKEVEHLTWETISRYFVGRSAYAVQCRYSKKLRSRQREAQEVDEGYSTLIHHNDDLLRRDHEWSHNEDELLLSLQEVEDLPWNEIAAMLPGHSHEDVKRRYYLLLDATTRERESKSNPEVRGAEADDNNAVSENRWYARFTSEEDSVLVRLREVEKLDWARVAEQFPGRSAHSVQKRYVRVLAPGRLERQKSTGGELSRNITRGGKHLNTDTDLTDWALSQKQSPRHQYRTHEGESILKLRNREELSGDEIAQQLPEGSPESVQTRYGYCNSRNVSSERPRHNSMALDLQTPRVKPFALVDPLIEHRTQDEIPDSENSPAAQPLDSNSPNQTDIGQDEDRQSEEWLEELGLSTPFADLEDDIVIQLRETQGCTWEEIAEHLPGRRAASIAARYRQVLRPHLVTQQIRDSVSTNDIAALAPSTGSASNEVLGSGPTSPSSAVQAVTVSPGLPRRTTDTYQPVKETSTPNLENAPVDERRFASQKDRLQSNGVQGTGEVVKSRKKMSDPRPVRLENPENSGSKAHHEATTQWIGLTPRDQSFPRPVRAYETPKEPIHELASSPMVYSTPARYHPRSHPYFVAPPVPALISADAGYEAERFRVPAAVMSGTPLEMQHVDSEDADRRLSAAETAPRDGRGLKLPSESTNAPAAAPKRRGRPSKEKTAPSKTPAAGASSADKRKAPARKERARRVSAVSSSSGDSDSPVIDDSDEDDRDHVLSDGRRSADLSDEESAPLPMTSPPGRPTTKSRITHRPSLLRLVGRGDTPLKRTVETPVRVATEDSEDELA